MSWNLLYEDQIGSVSVSELCGENCSGAVIYSYHYLQSVCMVTTKLLRLIRFTLQCWTRSNRVLSKNERGTDTRNAMNSRISYKVNNHNLDEVLALLIFILVLVGAESVPLQNHVSVFNATAAASAL